MSLRKLHLVGPDLWKWELAMRVDHRRIHRKFKDTEAGAHAIYSELLNQKNRAALGLELKEFTEAATLEHAASEYEKHIIRQGLSRSQIEMCTRALNLLRKVAGKVRIGQVTRDVLLRWRIERAQIPFGKARKLPKARTVNKDFDCLTSFLKYCSEQRNWITTNPAARVPRLKETPPPERFQEWEHFELMANAAWSERPALGLLLEIVGETGCRIMEAANATVGMIDAKRKQWAKIVKGGRRIYVPAGAWACAAAKKRKPEEPLCPRENGSHWGYNAIERIIPMMCERAGVPKITAHCLRHGRAVWDIEADVPIYYVRMKLGHTSVKTTEKYLRMATRREQPARARKVRLNDVKLVCLPCAPRRLNRSRTVKNVQIDHGAKSRSRPMGKRANKD